MPCNCGKGKKTVSSTNKANFSQGSSNIKRQPVARVRPPANKQNNVTPAGKPVIQRSIRRMPLGVKRVIPNRRLVRK
jgi:hypothetical protein